MPAATHEEELYALWEHHALTGAGFACAGGERVIVVSRGSRNLQAGPDYLGAVLLIDGDVKVGAVEMHLSEADWFAHGHHEDRAYERTILHIVRSAPRQSRLPIPTLPASVLSSGEHSAPAGGGWKSATITAELVAELSWSRLLRRAVEVLRSEESLSARDRLRRAFVRRLFDCLGYSRNRAQMCAVAESILADEPALQHASFDGTAALLFAASGLDPTRLSEAGRGWMGEARLHGILGGCAHGKPAIEWDMGTRPGNSPALRLWAGTKLCFDLYHNKLLPKLVERLLATGQIDRLHDLLVVRFGKDVCIGAERAREILVNALLPVALAGGIVAGNRRLIEQACLAYRFAPSLASNSVTRIVERRYLRGATLRGAFWQQGAIEFYQRYLLPDRSRLSFVAEASVRAAYRARAKRNSVV
jgi:hypothetical protein